MDNNHSISNFPESGILRRYVDILSEAGFKAVLCNKRNRDVLIDILNIALPPHKHVRSIAYSSTEIPGFTFANKSVRLDLRCTGDDGTEFIVELQCYRQDNFFRRCVEYAAKVYDAGSVRGDRHKYGLPPVYFIALLAGDAVSADRSDPVWKDRFIAEYTFREKLTGEVPDDTISIIFVELFRFTKELDQCESVVEQWFYAMKHVGTMDRLPDGLKNEVFRRFFEACEIERWDKDAKLSYEADMITERDYYNIIDTAREDGIAAGIAEGEAKGRSEGFAEGEAKGKSETLASVVKSMKAMNLPVETIMQATGLSQKEVEESASVIRSLG